MSLDHARIDATPATMASVPLDPVPDGSMKDVAPDASVTDADGSMTIADGSIADAAPDPLASNLDVSPHWQPGTPITLRAHNLLCLHGWEGMGYSPEFTANMNAIHAHLSTHPESEVSLIVGPDSLCEACPLLEDRVCHHDRHDSGWITQHDHRTLEQTGLIAGETYAWQAIEHAIAASFTGADIATFCTRCRWQPLGVCAAGIDRLRDRLSAALPSTTQNA